MSTESTALTFLKPEDYLPFLRELRKAGDKFPFLWKKILTIAQNFHDSYILMQPSTPVPDATTGLKLMSHSVAPLLTRLQSQQVDHIAINPEIETEERHLVNALRSTTSRLKIGEDEGLKAIGDGTLLRAFFAFLQANPQLLNLILSLIGIKLPGGIQV